MDAGREIYGISYPCWGRPLLFDHNETSSCSTNNDLDAVRQTEPNSIALSGNAIRQITGDHISMTAQGQTMFIHIDGAIAGCICPEPGSPDMAGAEVAAMSFAFHESHIPPSINNATFNIAESLDPIV
jgi:hypothetical protein